LPTAVTSSKSKKKKKDLNADEKKKARSTCLKKISRVIISSTGEKDLKKKALFFREADAIISFWGYEGLSPKFVYQSHKKDDQQDRGVAISRKESRPYRREEREPMPLLGKERRRRHSYRGQGFCILGKKGGTSCSGGGKGGWKYSKYSLPSQKKKRGQVPNVH